MLFLKRVKTKNEKHFFFNKEVIPMESLHEILDCREIWI